MRPQCSKNTLQTTARKCRNRIRFEIGLETQKFDFKKMSHYRHIEKRGDGAQLAAGYGPRETGNKEKREKKGGEACNARLF